LWESADIGNGVCFYYTFLQVHYGITDKMIYCVNKQ